MKPRSEPASASLPASAKIDDVQVLRACAILMVVSYHAKILHPYLPEFFHHGFTGVYLFFVISGFVITRSSLLMLPAPPMQFAAAFLLKRFFRIIPPATFWLLAYYVAFRLVNVDLSDEIWNIATLRYNYLMQSSKTLWLGHYWSLLVEEHFYFGFVLLFPLLISRRLIIPAGGGVMLLAIQYFRPYAGDAGHMTHALLDFFVAGMLIACLASSVQVATPRWLLTILSTASIVAIFGLFSIRGLPFSGYTLCMMLAATCVAIGATNQNVILPVPILRSLLIWIGERSYSIYLAQSLVIYADYWFGQNTRWMGCPTTLRIAVLLGVIFVAGHASYALIETPFDHLRRRLQVHVRHLFQA